jgi:radical SAM superfamily enzyme YgiQ (UPF0313 family)
MGCMYLAAYLRENGHEVKILDEAKNRRSIQSITNDILEYNPGLIAISGIITAYRYIIEITQTIKQYFPNIPIVVGGHITNDNYDQILIHSKCDYCIIGYGELKLLALVEFLEGKHSIDIPMLAYLKESKPFLNPGELFFTHIDDCPLPAYDLIDMDYYTTANTNYTTVTANDLELTQYLKTTGKPTPSKGKFPISGSRGCTDKCLFCIHELPGYKGFHVHSIEYIIRMVKHLYDVYNVGVFYIGEDLFLTSTAQARDLVREMNEKFPDVYFACSSRADFITPERIEILKNSNCFSLCYGFESGSASILKILKKRTTPEQNVKAYKLIKESGISPSVAFIIGIPGETINTIRETIDAIKQAGIMVGGIFYATPYPGSLLFRQCVEKGMIPNIHEYLLSISDRDASLLSINLTRYPNIVVKMMYVMIQNAFTSTRRDVILKGWVIPCVYFLIEKIDSILRGMDH